MAEPTPTPEPVWMFHPPSGGLQEVSRVAYDAALQLQQDQPNMEGPLHRWVPALPEQIALGEQVKAEKAARKAGKPWPPPVELEENPPAPATGVDENPAGRGRGRSGS